MSWPQLQGCQSHGILLLKYIATHASLYAITYLTYSITNPPFKTAVSTETL